MNKEQLQAVLQVIAGAVLAVAVAAGSLWGLSRFSGQPQQAVEPTFGAESLTGDKSNFSAIEIDTNSSTLAGIDVDQTGSGNIAVFRDGGSAVWTLADGGTVTYGGGLDLNGNVLTIDADADTTVTADTDDQIDFAIGGSDVISATAAGLFLSGSTLTWDADLDTTSVASFDDIITTTLGAGTGRFDLLTGNLKVGNGTEDTTLNGEDAYIEGTLEVDGSTNFDGAADFASTVAVGSSVNASADVDIGTYLNLSAQSTISVTAGAIITPTGSYQPLTSAAAGAACSTTNCLASGGETGDLLILHNINATGVITLDGTGGTIECKADVNLDAGDTISFIWNGSAWNCLANYDNS